MKVKISAKRVLLMWFGTYLIIGGLVTLMFFNLFYLTKWGPWQPIILGIYTAVMVTILIISLNTHYYEINKKDITECKFGKRLTYFYNEIIYIDEEGSKKSRILSFVTKFGHVKYLTFDKEGKIFEACMARCKNLITLEELREKFPGIKI